MDRTARTIEAVVNEVERAGARKPVFIAETDRNLVGKRTWQTRAFTRKGQVVGLAHVEVEIDRIERHEGGQQGGRAAASTAAGNETADRDQTRADTAGERRGNAGILKIQLSVANLCLGVVDRGLCRGLLRGALVD